MTTHALRDRYLQKVRAVEYATKVTDRDGNEEGLENLYSTEGYVPSVSSTNYISAENPSQDGTATTYANKIVTMGGDSFYPTMGLTDRMIQDYKANGPISTLPSVNFSISAISGGGKISIPSGSRHQYAATMVRYIESVGGITKDRNMFGTIDMNKFTIAGLDDNEMNNHGNWLRKDMLAYIDELHRRIVPKLGLQKLQINSAYRSTRVNYDMYSGFGGNRVYWDTHMAGMAIDIAASGSARSLIANAAYDMGFRAIAIGNGFVHIDCNAKGNWGYGSVPTYYSPTKPGNNQYGGGS